MLGTGAAGGGGNRLSTHSLRATSAELATMWGDSDVRAHGDGVRVLHHRTVGALSIEFSSFTANDRTDLAMVIYNPATAKDADKIRTLLKSRS